MCWRQICVDCLRCRREGVPTDEPYFDEQCGLQPCTRHSARNADEDIKDMMPKLVWRNGCPECIQHNTFEPSIAGLASLGSSNMDMAQGGYNMTSTLDPRYQQVQATGYGGQQPGNLAVPYRHYPEQTSLPEQGITKRQAQSRDDKCEPCRKGVRKCDVLDHCGEGIECSLCAKIGSACMFRGRVLGWNLSIRKPTPKRRSNVICDYCARSHRYCDCDGIHRCARCERLGILCSKDRRVLLARTSGVVPTTTVDTLTHSIHITTLRHDAPASVSGDEYGYGRQRQLPPQPQQTLRADMPEEEDVEAEEEYAGQYEPWFQPRLPPQPQEVEYSDIPEDSQPSVRPNTPGARPLIRRHQTE